MAEGFISRASFGSDQISNQTKMDIGLNNDATLDDVIKALSVLDNSYSTIMVHVLNPDGSDATDAKVRMLDYGGTNVVYSTDNSGKCVFKTNQVNANFYNDEIYEDINSQEIKVDTVIGSVKTITFNHQIYDSSYSKNFTSNKNIQFSNLINNITVEVSGGGGGAASGMCQETYQVWYNGTCTRMTNRSQSSDIGYAGGNGFCNSSVVLINPLTNYNIIIGAGGIGGKSHNKTTYYFEKGSSGAEIDGLCFRTAGNSGGGSSFGGLLSATGGGGGSTSSNSTVSGYGAKGGWKASQSFSGSAIKKWFLL